MKKEIFVFEKYNISETNANLYHFSVNAVDGSVEVFWAHDFKHKLKFEYFRYPQV